MSRSRSRKHDVGHRHFWVRTDELPVGAALRMAVAGLRANSSTMNTGPGFLGIHWNAIQWGDVPTWVTGVLTGSAVLATALGLRGEARKNRLDRQDRAEVVKRGQAQLVATWVDHLSLDRKDYVSALEGWTEPLQPGDLDAVGAVVFLRIRNASQLPVYGLTYSFSAHSLGTFWGNLRAVPPGTVAEVALPMPAAPRSDTEIPSIAFIDAGNRPWTRTTSGELEEGFGLPVLPEDYGRYAGVLNHPTVRLPRPIRWGTEAHSPHSGTVVFPTDR